MRIGVDLDGVVFDTEKELRVYSELFDMLELKQNSKIDNKKMRFQDRFGWTQEDVDNFLKMYHKQIVTEASFIPGAKFVLKKLKEDGHELIIITARGGINKSMIPITEERLKKEDMDIFDKYYWGVANKEEICIKENIDIMIDDFDENCKRISNANIRTIYLKDAPSYDLEENEYLKVLYNWGEIYRYIEGGKVYRDREMKQVESDFDKMVKILNESDKK